MFYCENCDGKTGVTESRGEVRRRKCKQCGNTFFTEEILCTDYPKIAWSGKRKRSRRWIMTVHGDMVAYLMCRHGLSPVKAKELVSDVLQCVDDPNFAHAYAKYDGDKNNYEGKMLQYFSVVKFLRATNGD